MGEVRGAETSPQRITREGGHLGTSADGVPEIRRRLLAAPTTPRLAETLGHAARALLAPTLTFIVAVSSEVYAERVFDRLLP